MEMLNKSTPYVGMLAAYVIGSDQYGGKLVAVSQTGHKVTWQRMDDVSGFINPHFLKTLSRRRNGEYLVVGGKYGHLKLGTAKTILDQGF